MKRKKSTKTKAKEKAWAEFSRFIRLRDSDHNGMVKCCTCDKVAHWKEMQAGHFPQGRGNSILFDEQAVHGQCYGCNVCCHGRLDIYAVFMIEKYGQGIIEEMNRRKWQSVTLTEIELLEIRDKYKRLAEIYLNQKKG
jgi:hypothetical protein